MSTSSKEDQCEPDAKKALIVELLNTARGEVIGTLMESKETIADYLNDSVLAELSSLKRSTYAEATYNEIKKVADEYDISVDPLVEYISNSIKLDANRTADMQRAVDKYAISKTDIVSVSLREFVEFHMPKGSIDDLQEYDALFKLLCTQVRNQEEYSKKVSLRLITSAAWDPLKFA
ncbi:unnamed protein product [Rotaria magnacalcarata]|nr:unnamed protein product [Rotaria magnacalcarata]